MMQEAQKASSCISLAQRAPRTPSGWTGMLFTPNLLAIKTAGNEKTRKEDTAHSSVD